MLKTKKQLSLSILSLVLCIAMLLGTTYAWFTDSVTSEKNKIIAGNLDIEMYWTDDYKKAEDGTGKWYNVEDPEHDKVFDYDNWEPGYTELRYLKIKNNGNLAFKYKLGIGAAGAIGKLAEVIDVYYIPEVTENIDTRAKLFNVDEDNARPTVGTLKYILENQNNGTVNPEGKLLPADATTVPGGYDKGEVVVALAFKMQEEAGNEYQNESIGEGFYITAVATQLEYEDDSFDEYYDKDRSFPELKLPKNVSEKADLDDSNKVKADTELENGTSVSATVPAGVEMEAGTKELVMTVKEVKKDEGNITADDTVISKTLDVHVEGVASGNTKPILVKIKNAVPSDMNRSAVVLYHTENSEKVKMTSKASLAEVTAHNDYYFDTDGNLTMALAHFSEILLKVDASNPWGGEVTTAWYNDTDRTFALSTAEQLAGLAGLVNGGNDFAGKTIVLDKSIVLNNWKSGERFYTPEELHNDNSPVYYDFRSNPHPEGKPYYFTPIGTVANPFKGTFNGDGHYISGLYRIHYGENDGYDNAYIGVFGCVDGATVKNLTVKDGFVESFGGLVGIVSATAKGDCTFDNIKIRNNYILTYNEYLGGVVGYYGAGTGTFKNISVDNTNNFGALWGTYDLPCGGIVGGVGSSTNISLTDCNIFPSMDLYNDCCANYQWFNYRYSGMLVGYLPGSDIASFAQSHITCTNVSVHYGEWTSQYYCELRSLGKGSYNGETEWKYTKISRNAGAAGNCGHNHAANNAQTTTWRGVEYGPNEAHEDHIRVNIAFRQLFGGGQGVKGVEAHNGVKTVEKGSISVKFPNTDKYLYRVGNMNTVALGSLFEKAQNTPNIDANAIDITAEQILGVTSVEYVKDASDWTKSTLKFSGTGVTKLILKYTNQEPVELNLEVVDAVNYGTNAGKVGTANPSLSATGYNVVLLNDVNDSLSVSNGYTLHGNGFTVADTRVADSDATIGMSKAYVYIIGGIVDNVFFKGYEPTEQVPLGNTKRQSSSAVIVQGTGSQIYNCHISGGRYAVLFYNAKDAYMESSVIDGGSVGCVGITNAYVTLKNCTTTISTQGGLKGAGIHVPSVDNGHLTILGSFEQHNWVQSNDLPDTYQSLVSDLYKNSDFKYDYNGKTYINAGIFFMSEANSIDTNQAKEFITDANDSMYVYSTKSSYGYTGTMRSAKASTGSPEMVAVADTSTTQYGVLPTYNFDFTDKNYKAKESGNNNYCYYDSTAKKVMISYDKTTSDTTFSWDPDILSVTKFGNALIPEYSILPATGWTKENGKVLFAEEGDYTVTYTYTDPYNYDKDLNSGSKTYTHTVNLNIVNVKPEAVVYHPVFTYADSWSSYSSKQVVVNNKTYIMPDATATSDKVGSTTVGGQTIYYPIISLDGKDSGGNKYSSGKIYYFAPAFKAININDLNKDTGNTLYTYNTGTTTWPHGLSATTKITQGEYFGYGSTRPYGAGTGATYEKCAKNTNNGGLCFTSNEIERNVTESSVLVEFYYVGNDGITYYYYIKYHYNATTYSGGCLIPGTLITMADGTQKPVEEIKAGDMLLTWDLTAGTYGAKPVVFNDYEEAAECDVIYVTFSDGTEIGVISEHGFFDKDLGKYVYLDENAAQYLGHAFIKEDGSTETLTNVEIRHEYTECYSPTTFGDLCYYTNGMLSMPGGISGLFNIFDVDSDTMRYDEAKMRADIETYGLLDMDAFGGMITEDMFNAFNGKYLGVAVGKGNLTWEYIAYLAERYAPLCK